VGRPQEARAGGPVVDRLGPGGEAGMQADWVCKMLGREWTLGHVSECPCPWDHRVTLPWEPAAGLMVFLDRPLVEVASR
jgi:hypothetical protein